MILAAAILATTGTAIYSADPINSWQKMSGKVKDLSSVETIYIDNSFVQTYRGVLGIWKFAYAGEKFIQFRETYGSDIKKLIELNELNEKDDRVRSNSWVFIPFSEEYLARLADDNIGRFEWQVPKGEFIWPVVGVRITSRLGERWGRMHPGVDIAVPTGSLVVAAMDGVVQEAGPRGAYGKAILLAHGEDYISKYAHLSQIFVKEGDVVAKGEVIGLSGSTGRSTGPHLHFEVRCMNLILNPEFFLPEFTESMQASIEAHRDMESRVNP